MRAAARVTFLATLAGVGFIVSPAQAQILDWGYGFGRPRPPIVDRPARYYLERPIPSGEVIEILRDEGYRPLSRPTLSGDAYVAEVENRRGQRLQVVVHAYDGDILERRLITGRPSPERPTARRPSQRDEAALPPRDGAPVESAPLSPVTPPPVQSAPLPPRPEGQASAPPAAHVPAPPQPRENQTVTPPRPATPPAVTRPREPARAAVPPSNQAPPKLEQNPAPTLETTEAPREQQARSPRVVLPNPADSSQNSMPPPTSLETQPSNPAPPTPPVAPAPLN